MKHVKTEKVETQEENKSFSWKKKLICFFGIIIVLTVSILLYSRYIATTGLVIKEYKITNSNIPEQFHGLKIAHISDLHFGRTVKLKELQKLVEKVNLTKPDIIVFTGDLIDKDTSLTTKEVDEISNELKKMNTTIGKYAIRGEEDLQFKNWDFMMENGSFTILNNSYDTIYKDNNSFMLISSIHTIADGNTKVDEKLAEVKGFISGITDEELKPKYNILLLHEPDSIDEIDLDQWNLVLAGHSHNGQVRLPFIGALFHPDHAKKYYEEHYTINNTELYISGGIGVSDVNFRLWNRPSFNLYRLTRY